MLWTIAVILLVLWALGLVSMCMDLSSELIHSLLPLYMATALGASAQSKMPFEIEAGYRFSNVGGNEDLFRTQINERDGFQIRSFSMFTTDFGAATTAALDHFRIDASDLGAGPSSTLRIDAGKSVGLSTVRDVGQCLARRRIEDGEGATVGRRSPLAADDQLGRYTVDPGVERVVGGVDSTGGLLGSAMCGLRGHGYSLPWRWALVACASASSRRQVHSMRRGRNGPGLAIGVSSRAAERATRHRSSHRGGRRAWTFEIRPCGEPPRCQIRRARSGRRSALALAR